MEPVFIILGQSAAIIASMALDEKASVQQTNYPDLKKKLIKAGQVIDK
jgi:hypothetical protein